MDKDQAAACLETWADRPEPAGVSVGSMECAAWVSVASAHHAVGLRGFLSPEDAMTLGARLFRLGAAATQ